IVKDKHAFNLVEESLSLIGFEEKVKPDLKVFIKPNFVRAPPILPYKDEKGAYEVSVLEADDIHPDIVEGTIRYLQKLGVHDITIGEGAKGCETTIPYKAYGMYAMAEKYSVKLVDLNYEDAVKVPIPNKLWLDYVWVPKVILESDLIINESPLKIHGSTVVTLCIKNWGLGIPPAKYYGWNITGHYIKGIDAPMPIHQLGTGERIMGQEVSVSKALVDVAAAKGWHISLIDGLTSGYHKGFSERNRRRYVVERTNMVLASADMVAADAVASAAMSLDPKKILHIKWAEDRGLGTCDLSKIEVKGASIEEVRIKGYPLYSQREVMIE
ncbi:MAG: DUF362 domain-containing protein, partial [Candidatus Bathyarchaeia archaeon]